MQATQDKKRQRPWLFANAFRNVSAADSGVISRCGEARSSKPTMNFRTVAERSSGG